MRIAIHRQQIKSSMLPVAIIVGALFYKWIGYLSFLSPYLIFAMLFVTYCKLEPKEFKPHRSQVLELAIQLGLAAAVYLAILPFSHTVAEGVFICVFIPTATAAPVITSMLGGSISYVATYSLICNTVIAFAGSAVLALVGDYTAFGFWESTWLIMCKVFPLLILPMVCAFLLRYIWPQAHRVIEKSQQLSFYMWVVALILIVGNCVGFVILHWDESQLMSLIWMVAGALGVCLLQFVVGRKLGEYMMRRMRSRGETVDKDLRVSCAQSLMQKNTVLAIWLAMAYMTPLASVAPAAYIAWQNILNSWQLFRHESDKMKKIA